MNIAEYNRQAWDGLVARKNEWTIPVSADVISAARQGHWSVVLTPRKPVPSEWFPPLPGMETLCLAGAGGQQAPVLAAAGARVTVLDNSPRQLAQDRAVAMRDGLSLETVEGDMRDLSRFADNTFGLVFHPCANCFVPDIRPVWKEAARVLRPGGILLAGFVNPVAFIFDEALADQGTLKVRHPLPYSDLTSITEEERRRLVEAGEPFSFSHSLEEQIGGQLDAGLTLTALYEDTWPGRPLSTYLPTFIATRALKPSAG